MNCLKVELWRGKLFDSDSEGSAKKFIGFTAKEIGECLGFESADDASGESDLSLDEEISGK